MSRYAVMTAIGTNRNLDKQPYYKFCDQFLHYNFHVEAVFRKHNPQSMVITPRDTCNTGIFIFASIEWGDSLVLETLRSTLLTAISLGMHNLRAIWVELNKSIKRAYGNANTRSVIGCVRKNRIDYITNRLSFYKVSKDNSIELIDFDNLELGNIDLEQLISSENKELRNIVKTISIDNYEELIFLPDLLIWEDRFKGYPHDFWEYADFDSIDGYDILNALIQKNAKLLPEDYFELHFLDCLDFSKFSIDKLGLYLFCFNTINKGTNQELYLSRYKNKESLSSVITVSEYEMGVLKHMINQKFIIATNKIEYGNGEVYHQIELKNSLFPSLDDEDLSILRITL